MFVPGLAVANEELQHAMPQRRELEGEDDDNDNRGEELDGRKLRRRAQAGELQLAWIKVPSQVQMTYQITIEDMVD